ncbi:hypothetical protein, partial [Peribacillus frigoritolerans]|uniref:hypothetical protein n=1 Tax=Peribacillus frigoritolerans TaxID=450367 RepID=UPI001E2AA164
IYPVFYKMDNVCGFFFGTYCSSLLHFILYIDIEVIFVDLYWNVIIKYIWTVVGYTDCHFFL